MLDELELDERDWKIVELFMSNPESSQTEIATSLGLSQPSVNSRIQKLRARGILWQHVGMNYNKTGLILTRVDFTATQPHIVLAKLKDCSFFVNGFILSGKHNLSVFLIHKDLKKVDEIINEYLRADNTVSDIESSVVVSSAHDFIFRLNLKNKHAGCKRVGGCSTCEYVKKVK